MLRNHFTWITKRLLILTTLAIAASVILAAITGQHEAMMMAVAAPAAAAHNSQPAVMTALPFVASSHEHVEPAFTVTVTPGAAAQQLNPIDIPASGYFRYLFLEVVAAGGTGGTIDADGPWNIFQSIHLHDVQGGKIFGPMDGYAAYIANLLGGYSGRPNPVDSPWYVGTSPNPAFYLRIPLELARKNGLGSLANQSSASEYKLDIAINTLAAAFSVAPSPVPTYTIKGWLEAWTLPALTNNRGQLQSQVPPLLGTGQVWTSRTQQGIAVGDNTLRSTRVGNYWRLIAWIARNSSGVRANNVFPDPLSWTWDGTTIRKMSQNYMRQEVYEKLRGAVTLPTGVFALLFNTANESASVGNEDPDLWLPTSGTSRIEIQGTAAAAGSWQELINDVAPIEEDVALRAQTPNATGTLVSP